MAKDKTLTIPKNKNKLKLWQSAHLNQTMQTAVELLASVQTVSDSADTSPEKIGVVGVPAYLLYEICEGYIIMYEKLLKEQLLITANPKSNPVIH